MCSACCAVDMTAGHNALRGSGPDQKHAFEDAVAHVGCPDRRTKKAASAGFKGKVVWTI